MRVTAHLHPREAGGGSDRKQENQWSEKKTVSALLQTEHNPEEAQTRAAELSSTAPRRVWVLGRRSIIRRRRKPEFGAAPAFALRLHTAHST